VASLTEGLAFALGRPLVRVSGRGSGVPAIRGAVAVFVFIVVLIGIGLATAGVHPPRIRSAIDHFGAGRETNVLRPNIRFVAEHPKAGTELIEIDTIELESVGELRALAVHQHHRHVDSAAILDHVVIANPSAVAAVAVPDDSLRHAAPQIKIN
jgi:hypothetical protein